MSELVRPWQRKDLLGLEDLRVEEIRLILDTAESLQETAVSA